MSAICNSQGQVVNFYFEGYKAIFIPSDTFRIEIKNPALGKKEIKNGILRLTVIEPTGRMPKDTVYIYTNKIRSVSMAYSEIEMPKQMSVDSLRVSMGGGSYGIINVKAEYLEISTVAASRVKIIGETHKWKFYSKGYSSIDDIWLRKCKEGEILSVY